MSALRVANMLLCLTAVHACWDYEPHRLYYESSTITCIVTWDHIPRTTGLVGFKVNGEIRGHSTTVKHIPQVFPLGKQDYYEFAGQIFGNASDEGKALSFVYTPDDSSGDCVEYGCTQTNSAVDTSTLVLHSNYGNLLKPVTLACVTLASPSPSPRSSPSPSPSSSPNRQWFKIDEGATKGETEVQKVQKEKRLQKALLDRFGGEQNRLVANVDGTMED